MSDASQNGTTVESACEEVRVDPDFRSLCPPLTQEERTQLEENLVAEQGAREPLVTWQGFLLDGHNRYEICKRLGLSFTTVQAKGVGSREEALAWIVKNQLGRRNLTPEQASYLRGRRYNLEKGEQGGSRATGKTFRLETAEKLAQEFKVTDRTIRSDGAFAAAVDTLATNLGPDFREKLLTRGSRMTRTAVVKLAALPAEQQAQRAQETEVSPKKRPIKRRPVPKAPKGFIERPAPPAKTPLEGGSAFESFDAIPSGAYRCLYMDPPWEYPDGDHDRVDGSRRAVPNSELAALDLARICDPAGAHLWIWTTWWLLRNGFVENLLKRWGFNWVAEAVWVKGTPSPTAHSLKPMTELLLLATSKRGSLEIADKSALALLTGPPDETGKPSEARELAMRCTRGSRIQLFARRHAEAWDVFAPELAADGGVKAAVKGQDQ